MLGDVNMNLQTRSAFQMLAGLMILSFGIYCFVRPDLAVFTLSRLFAVVLLVFGGVSVSGALSLRRVVLRWWVQALEGLMYVLLAGLLLASPASILFFTRVLGLWAMLVGLFRFISASVRQIPMGFTTFGGTMSFLFGLILFVYPQAVAGFLSVLIGILLILFGMAVLSGGLFIGRFR